MRTKQSFVMYHDFWNLFRFLTNEELGALLRAIYTYEKERILPCHMNETTQMAFFTVKEILDRDRAKYEATCNKNRKNAEIRWSRSNQKPE